MSGQTNFLHELRTMAASHARNGESRTAFMLRAAADRLEKMAATIDALETAARWRRGQRDDTDNSLPAKGDE